MRRKTKSIAVVVLCAVLAFAGYKFFSEKEAAEQAEETMPSAVIAADPAGTPSARPLAINADSAVVTTFFGDSYEITDRAALNALETLLVPVYDAKKAPRTEEYYNLCFYCGDTCRAADVYIDDDAVFADTGSGPYLVCGTPAEVSAIIVK